MNFDQHALDYEQELCQGLRWSGSGPEYFAEQRIEFVRQQMQQQRFAPQNVVDFGCGVGNHVPLLRQAFPGCRVTGIDISPVSLRVARQRHPGKDTRFMQPGDFHEQADLVYLNGVLHHVPTDQQDELLGYLANIVRPGGWLVIFDNNPLSLPARLVMRSIPFDREAVMVGPRRLVRMARIHGLANPRVHYHFIFPRLLGFLRPVEQALTRLPLGAQYSITTQKAS